MASVAASMQEQFEIGRWFASEEGGFGVNSSFSKDVKDMLSTQNITSHISIISLGCIPSIKSNQVQLGVKTFANFDPDTMMGNLATLANATSTDKGSVDASAEAARTGANMMAIQGSTIESVMLGLDKIDDGANSMLDVNSLMTAFEDYVEKAMNGEAGIPINFFLKPITRSQLAKMWVSKYYPGDFLEISGDDSKKGGDSGGDEPAGE